MATIDQIEIPLLQFAEAAAPSTPGAGLVRIYAKADGKMYSKDDAGAETELGPGSGGIPATIFDAKGDIIAASAADTAARLAVGATGQVLTPDSGEATGLKWAGGAVLLTTASPNGAAVDFTSITAGYKHLWIPWQARGTDNATQTFNLIFNNDSGSNYDYMRHFLNSGGFSAASDGVATTFGECGVATQADLANYPHQGQILIANYSATSFYKSYSAECSYIEAASGTNMYVHKAVGWWRDTSAISRVTLTPAAGNFANGSYFELWGLY